MTTLLMCHFAASFLFLQPKGVKTFSAYTHLARSPSLAPLYFPRRTEMATNNYCNSIGQVSTSVEPMGAQDRSVDCWPGETTQ